MIRKECRRLVLGQRLAILAYVFFLASIALMALDESVTNIVGIIAVILFLVFSFVGMFMMSLGLRDSLMQAVFVAFVTFIPMLGFFVLVHVNGETTKTLRENGFKVSLFGPTKNI